MLTASTVHVSVSAARQAARARWRERRRKEILARRCRLPAATLKSFALRIPRRMRHQSIRAAREDRSDLSFLQKRRRVVDVLRERRRSGLGFVRTVPRCLAAEALFWKTLRATCCTAAVHGSVALWRLWTTGKASMALMEGAAVWPASFTVAVGAMILTEAQWHHARLAQAQKAMHNVLVHVQDLMRLGMTGLTTTIEKRRFGKWLTILAYALRGTLMATDDVVHDDLCKVLTPSEFFALVESKDRVRLALQVTTEAVSSQCIDVYLAATMTSAIDVLSHETTQLVALVQPRFESTSDIWGGTCAKALAIWSATFPVMTAATSTAMWSIPLTALASFLLYSAAESSHEIRHRIEQLPLDAFCLAVKESVHQIQLDHTHIRRIKPCGGFSYGSNVLPIDNRQEKPQF